MSIAGKYISGFFQKTICPMQRSIAGKRTASAEDCVKRIPWVLLLADALSAVKRQQRERYAGITAQQLAAHLILTAVYKSTQRERFFFRDILKPSAPLFNITIIQQLSGLSILFSVY